MIKIYILAALLYSNSLLAQDWTGISDCGLYRVSGIVRLIKGRGLKIFVNEKTRSEIVVSPKISDQPTLAPYIDKDVLASVRFEKKLAGAEVSGSIVDIKRRFPNPLDPKDTGVEIISKKECSH